MLVKLFFTFSSLRVHCLYNWKTSLVFDFAKQRSTFVAVFFVFGLALIFHVYVHDVMKVCGCVTSSQCLLHMSLMFVIIETSVYEVYEVPS